MNHTEILSFEKSWCDSNEWIVKTNAGYLNVRKDRKGYYVSGGVNVEIINNVPTTTKTITDEFEQQLIEMAKAMPKCPTCEQKKCKCTI